MKYSFYKSKENWEQARLISYLIAQVNSKKKIKLEDIMKFSWDEKNKENSDTYISSEDIQRLSNQAEEMEKLFAKNQ